MTSNFSTWSVTIWHTHSPYDRNIYCPLYHLKRTNSNSSTRKLRLKSVTNGQVVAHKSWVAKFFPSTPGFSRSNLHNLPIPLQSCDLWVVVNENPDGKKKLASRYEFHLITVLPHNSHLKLDLVMEKLFTPRFRQRNLNLTILLHFPTPPLINIRNRNIRHWSQPASSWIKWWDSINPWSNNITFSEN